MFLLSTTFASTPPSQEAPDGTLDALWAALSHEPLAGADAARLREIFHPEARVFALRFEDGEPRVVVRSAAEFIARMNSLQLAREGGRWRILSLYYSQEKPGVPIPADWRAASFTYPGTAAPALQ